MGFLEKIYQGKRVNKLALAAKSGNHVGLQIAICLFLVLDCSILGINYYITVQVERDAQAINISGRQRMLSQRITKVLLLLERDSRGREQNLEELKNVYELFSSTLNGFYQGGRIVGGDGEHYEFEAVHDALARKYILDAQAYFAPIAEPVSKLINQTYSEPLLNSALAAAQKNNLRILKLMNSLTYRIEQLSQNKTRSLRWMQTIAFCFAILNFVIIIMIYHKRSRLAEGQVENFLSLVDSAAASILVLDANRKIILANLMTQELFGYEKDSINNMAEADLFKRINNDCFAVKYDGLTLRVEIVEKRFTLHNNEFIILTVNDISSFTEEQERLAYLANHDSLTGLVNRRALYDRLDLEILHAKRAADMLGILFLDLNGFKPVNDKFGHAAGDELLKQLSLRISEVVRETDTVSRYGGDEFVIVITGVQNENYLTKCQQKIEQVFDKPFITNGKQIKLGCSFGIAKYPEDASSAGELIEIADNRMYKAKALSR